MKQGKIGMSLRHAPGKFLVVGRFLEKIVSALLPFLTMLVSARFIDLVLNQRMEEAIRDACLLGALILCQRLGGNLDTWMRIHQRKVLFPYLDERMIGKISRIPYGFLENTEIQDALERGLGKRLFDVLLPDFQRLSGRVADYAGSGLDFAGHRGAAGRLWVLCGKRRAEAV